MADPSSSGILSRRPNPSIVDAFWKYVAERHAIWQRRQEGLAAPWTTDPILAEFHFCNVFRELDQGCLWYKNYVASVLPYQFPEVLWRTIVFRLVNNWRMFNKNFGGIPDRSEWRDMIVLLRKRGVVLNSPAHLTLPRPLHLHNRLDRFEHILDLINREFQVLVSTIQHADSLQKVSLALQSEYGIGPFIALQIYRDLIMVGQLPFNDDDWVEFGPGAERGIQRMVPTLKRVSEMRNFVLMLRESQWGAWKRLHLTPVKLENHDISLCDIEHNLCEFSRYCTIGESSGGRRRRYRPSASF